MQFPYAYWRKNQNEKTITVYDNDIARASSIDEAVFIRRMIYLWEKYRHNKEIFIIPKNFAHPVGMSVYIFRKIVKKWCDKGIISTKNRGMPLKKWYKIDEKQLALYLSQLKERGESLQVIEFDKISYRIRQDKLSNSTRYYNKRDNSNKNISVAGKPDNGDINNSSFGNIVKKTFDELCSIKLEKLIREKKKLCRKVNKKQWNRQFGEFRRKSGFKKKRIREVLLWYICHFGEKYVPKAYSAKGFCDKFLNIEDAMERHAKDKKEGNVTPKYKHTHHKGWIIG